jgi:amino acid transporter/nucleotide-binding universal stress UspA family protein
MPDEFQQSFQKKIKRVNFDRRFGLFHATTIGVGALMGAGVYVLIGLAANAAGPSVVLSYILCGLLAMFTTLMFADFSRINTKSGGGYIYVYDTLGGMWGFATGWFLALGSLFACGLYAIGFAQYAISFSGLHVHPFFVKTMAILVVVGLMILNTRQTGKGFRIQAILTWGNIAILLTLILFSFFYLDIENVKPVFPHGFKGTTAAISVIYISFFGYQLIANNADEIIEPEKVVPKAMKLSMIISLTIYVLIAFVAVMSVPWHELASSNAPLVLLADRSFGGYGWLIISFGGVLASLAALNSTLVSQSRQVFVMGKHRFFPDILGKLDEITKTPKAALYLGGVLIVLALIFFDLEFIAKSANFCLLISLVPVSIALRKIYLKDPSKKPKQKWRRYLPELALLANLGLLMTLDIVSLAFGQQLALIGAAIYFFYARKREKRARKGVNISLTKTRKLPFFTGNRILVPVANPASQGALLAIAQALFARKGGEIVVMAIKDVPGKMDFYEALSDAGPTLEVIQRSIELAKETNTEIKPVVRASRNIASGIIEGAEEEDCNLIIMGYADHVHGNPANNMDKILNFSSVDMAFLRLYGPGHNFKPQKILVYIRDNISSDLLFIMASALAEKYGAVLKLVYRLPVGYNKKQKSRLDSRVADNIQKLNSIALYEVQLKVTDDIGSELITMSGSYDLIVFGTNRKNLSKEALQSATEYKIAEQVQCDVLLIKEVPAYKKLLNKL